MSNTFKDKMEDEKQDSLKNVEEEIKKVKVHLNSAKSEMIYATIKKIIPLCLTY